MQVSWDSNRILSRDRDLASALLLLATLTRLWNLKGPSLWMDDAFSHLFAVLPMETAWSAMITDAVHPPLYYLLLRPWLDLAGASEFALRFPSVIAGVLTVALVIRVGRQWLGRRAAGLAGLLLAVNPFHVWYSQEARMYALLGALALAVLAAFWEALRLRQTRSWIALEMLSGCAYSTHYFALFLPLVQFVYLLATFRRHHRALVRWTVTQAAAFLPLAAWLTALYSTGGGTFGIGWIPRPGPDDLLKTFWAFTMAYDGRLSPLVLVGTSLSAVLLLWAVWRAAESRGTKMLLLLSVVLPPLITLSLSARRPAYVDRYFIGSLPPLIILIGAGLAYIPRLWRWGAVLALVGLGARDVARLPTDPMFAREGWREAALYVQTHEKEDDVLALRRFGYRVPFDYYRGHLEINAVTLNRRTTALADLASGHQRLWLVYRGPHVDPHHLAWSQPFDLESDEKNTTVRDWILAHQGEIVKSCPGVYVWLFHLGERP